MCCTLLESCWNVTRDWELNATHQFLAHADGVNLLGENVNTAQRNLETLFEASNEVCLDAHAEETKDMYIVVTACRALSTHSHRSVECWCSNKGMEKLHNEEYP